MAGTIKEMLEIWEGSHVKEAVALFEQGGKPEADELDIEASRKKADYHNWFDLQIQRLLEGGVPAGYLEMVEKKKESVVNQAVAISWRFREDEIPFILVPAVRLISIPVFVQMATCSDYSGSTLVDPGKIADLVSSPDDIWYTAFGLRSAPMNSFKPESTSDGESGAEYRDKILRAMERFWLTVLELIAICVFTEAAANYPLVAGASRFNGETSLEIPCVNPGSLGPELVTCREGELAGNTNWPSCRYRQ